MKQVIVIGGGPAGMMAAVAAARAGNHVVLLEKNEKLGKKIYITGKGRGNFTNSIDISEFFENIVHNPKFLYSALYGFSNLSVLDFFEENGLRWKEERGGRIFPVSDHASDITKALVKALNDSRVEFRTDTRVTELLTASDDEYSIVGVKTAALGEIYADHVVVATGGVSYPQTGSTGDGLKFASETGIKTVDPLPALVPLETGEQDIWEMQGLALKNVSFSVFDGKKKLYSGFGEMLFTHFGISGPLVLSASSRIAGILAEKTCLTGTIDLKPAISVHELDKRLLKHIDEYKNKSFSRFFEGILPGKMQQVMVDRSSVASDRKIASITKEERLRIVSLLKNFSMTITKTRGFSEAIVTQGGVSVKELDPQTMKARRFSGLSFAGEVIDVDALTGGFNLQIAFSTGYLAGNSIR